MRALATYAALVAVLAACFDDGAPTSQVGGTQFNMRLTVPSPVRTPTGSVSIFQRTVSGNRLIDSVTVSLSLVEPLQGAARYQLWVVNALDSTARPVRGAVTRTRTDTTFNSSGGVGTSTQTTADGQRAFFEGVPFNTTATIKIGPTQAADSIGQTSAFLVLTIQADTANPSFGASTPKPMWFRLRDQRGTPSLADDVISANGAMTFGWFESVALQRVFRAQGFGRAAFWDRFADGTLHLSALAFGLTQPPTGYHYVPVTRNSTLGRAVRLGELVDANTGESLRDADLRPITGTVAQLPDARFAARDDSLMCSGSGCAYDGFAGDEIVQLLLEPKLGHDSLYGVASVLQGQINLQLVDTRRAAPGDVVATVERAGQPVSGAVVALYGAGGTTVFASGVTAADGRVSFTKVPATRIDARVVPPTGMTIADQYQRNLLVQSGDTLRVTFQLQ